MRPIKTPKFILPRLFQLFTVLLILSAGLAYAGWQGRHLIIGPELTITDEPEVVQTGRVIMLSGVASNVTELTLNGRPIVTDRDGNFMEGIVLENGYSVVSIDAHDRFGRSVHWEAPVVYVEEESMAQAEEVGWKQ